MSIRDALKKIIFLRKILEKKFYRKMMWKNTVSFPDNYQEKYLKGKTKV